MWAGVGWGQEAAIRWAFYMSGQAGCRVKLWLIHGIRGNTYLWSFVMCWDADAMQSVHLDFMEESFCPQFEQQSEIVSEQAEPVGRILADFQPQKKSRLMERV